MFIVVRMIHNDDLIEVYETDYYEHEIFGRKKRDDGYGVQWDDQVLSLCNGKRIFMNDVRFVEIRSNDGALVAIINHPEQAEPGYIWQPSGYAMGLSEFTQNANPRKSW